MILFWYYKTVLVLQEDLEDILSSHGASQWELVQVLTQDNGKSFRLFFKKSNK